MNPSARATCLASAVARYNGARGGKASSTDCGRGPATRAQLERECHEPQATKPNERTAPRGLADRGRGQSSEAAPDGCVNVATLYQPGRPGRHKATCSRPHDATLD